MYVCMYAYICSYVWRRHSRQIELTRTHCTINLGHMQMNFHVEKKNYSIIYLFDFWIIQNGTNQYILTKRIRTWNYVTAIDSN